MPNLTFIWGPVFINVIDMDLRCLLRVHCLFGAGSMLLLGFTVITTLLCIARPKVYLFLLCFKGRQHTTGGTTRIWAIPSNTA